jgi:hypothetical protein
VEVRNPQLYECVVVTTLSWTSLAEPAAQRFVAAVALEVLRVAPDERSEADALGGTITLPDLGLRMELGPLSERCAKLPEDEWGNVIADQISRWITPTMTPAAFEDAEDSLSVRLLNAVVDAEAFSRTLAPGLVAELCLDLKGRIAAVTRASASTWQRSEGELWELAIANLGTDGAIVDSFVLEEPSELTFFHVHGEGAFVASLALRMPDLGEAIPRYGWLFMVPNRQSLWFMPIEELAHCAVGTLMLERAVDDLKGGLIPISGQIYWTNGNRIDGVSPTGISTAEELTEAIVRVVRAGNAS